MAINNWLDNIQSLMILIGILFGIYMVAKIISAVQEQNINTECEECVDTVTQPKPKEQKKLIDVEITDTDLRNKAKNLIELHDVYGLQMEHLTRGINEIDDKLQEIRNPLPQLTHNNKLDMTNPIVKELIRKSLKMQEQRAKLDGKMMKINSDLDKIARMQLQLNNR
jgi:hypothetical protein